MLEPCYDLLLYIWHPALTARRCYFAGANGSFFHSYHTLSMEQGKDFSTELCGDFFRVYRSKLYSATSFGCMAFECDCFFGGGFSRCFMHCMYATACNDRNGSCYPFLLSFCFYFAEYWPCSQCVEWSSFNISMDVASLHRHLFCSFSVPSNQGSCFCECKCGWELYVLHCCLFHCIGNCLFSRRNDIRSNDGKFLNHRSRPLHLFCKKEK